MNHNILLLKLGNVDIRGEALELMKSYLSNRKQCVRVGDVQRELRGVRISVPQGSILGHLLFTDDMHKFPLKGLLSLFTDDLSIFCSNHSSNNDPISDIAMINEFIEINKLSLNAKITKVMHFQVRRKKGDYEG